MLFIGSKHRLLNRIFHCPCHPLVRPPSCRPFFRTPPLPHPRSQTLLKSFRLSSLSQQRESPKSQSRRRSSWCLLLQPLQHLISSLSSFEIQNHASHVENGGVRQPFIIDYSDVEHTSHPPRSGPRLEKPKTPKMPKVKSSMPSLATPKAIKITITPATPVSPQVGSGLVFCYYVRWSNVLMDGGRVYVYCPTPQIISRIHRML